MNYYLSNLVIEITRICNMSCDHCLRGEAENIIISDKIIESFFKTIKNTNIGTIVISGGEPSLFPSKIYKIVKEAKKNKIFFSDFFIATNGKKVTKKFINSIINLYNYCSNNETSSLKISSDQFHEKIKYKNLAKLKIFSFLNHDTTFLNHQYLINTGNMRLNFNKGRDIFSSKIELIQNDNDYIVDNNIMLNAIGNLISDCNLSYTDQNNNDYIIIKDVTKEFNLIKKIKEFNSFV